MTEAQRLVKDGIDAWNRGDFEAMAKLLHPEFEVDATTRVFNPDRYAGVEGFRRLTKEMFEVWEWWRVEPTEMIERGDVVFLTYAVLARGKGSGVELAREYSCVWTLRDSLAVRLELYADRDSALAAAGLPAGA